MASTLTTSTISFNNVTRSDVGNTGFDAYTNAITDGVYSVWSLQIEEYTDQTYTVTLDSVDYDIRLRWNTRDESWWCAIGISSENPSCTFKCVNGLDLLNPYKYLEGVPDGQLYFIDTVKVNGRPDYYNSGNEKRYQLFYIDANESQS